LAVPRASQHKTVATQHIDYTITQFVLNDRRADHSRPEVPFGYGYHVHNWGVQPRHSTAHWLHFWCPDTAGVVLNCYYDQGVPHHYTFLWHAGREYKLYSPAHFTFDPRSPQDPWRVHSPDLELSIRPLAAHHSRMKIPPLLAYIDIDYYEQLVKSVGLPWSMGSASRCRPRQAGPYPEPLVNGRLRCGASSYKAVSLKTRIGNLHALLEGSTKSTAWHVIELIDLCHFSVPRPPSGQRLDSANPQHASQYTGACNRMEDLLKASSPTCRSARLVRAGKPLRSNVPARNTGNA
jgi:hypothetical protein